MFHLYKRSRVYSGHPYCGPTSDGLPAEYLSLEMAREKQKEFSERNPVGWNIYDAQTGELIDGVDDHV